MASVLAPDKRMWKVGRRWLPRHPRLPRRGDRDRDPTGALDGGGFDVLDLADGGVSAIVVAAVVTLVLALAFLVAWPLLALAIELIVLIFLALAGVIGRVVFRRPWRIVARTDGPPAERLAWDVTGWRGSRAAIEAIETALRSGREPRPEGAKQVEAKRPVGELR